MSLQKGGTMAKKDGDHFVIIKYELTRDEKEAVGIYVLDKLSFVNPGETRTFKILIPAGQTSTVVGLYNREERRIGEITVDLGEN